MNRLFFLLFAMGLANLLMAQAPTCCNILTNGDFEDGDVGFSSDLPQVCGCAGSSYCVNTNLQTKCSGWQNVNDHTSGSGNFLIVDGEESSPLPVDVWQINTTINAGVNYCFSFWVVSQYDSPFDLGLAVNGTLVPGAIFTVQQGTASWTQYTFNWTATNPGNNISIQQLAAGSFQDFGIDDIEFGQELIAGFSFTPNPGCAMDMSFFSQSSGPAPLTYSWNFNDFNSPGNISSLQNPTHKFTDCGTYDVCLTVSRGSCSHTYCESIVVEDIDPPTALCIGVGIELDANCMASVTPALIDGGSFDNCYIASMSVSPKVLVGCGFHAVTLTVTDSCGNTSSCAVDIQASEAIPPEIICPANLSVNAIPTPCTIQVNGLHWLSASDNCGIPSVDYVVSNATQLTGANDVSGNTFNQGHNLITYTATDGCGNTASCSFQLTVTCETENCACPAGGASGPNLIVNGNFSSGPSGFSSGLALNTTCGAGFYNVDKSFHLFCPPWDTLPDHTNDVQRKYLILDGADNGINTKTDLWTSNVVITANTNYCFSFWWASAYANADFNFTVEAYINYQGQDYVLGSSLIVQNTTVWTLASYNWNSTPFPILAGPQVLRIRQISGDDHRDFGIDDICFRAEQVPCEVDFTFQNIDNCGKIQFASTASGPAGFTYCWDFDNNPATCESTLPNPMWQFPACGTYNVCLTISGNGCSKTVCHTVVVVDNTPPNAVCVGGLSVVLDANCTAGLTVNDLNLGSTDNCMIQSLSISQNTFTQCSVYQVVLTVTDWCGNTSTCSAPVNVVEQVKPVLFNCPQNLAVIGSISPNGLCTAQLTLPPSPTATDNCDPSVTVTNNAPAIFPAGNSTVVWTATDDCGNTATCSIIVNVSCESCACSGTSSQNLVANGNFALGNVGFTSGLVWDNGAGCAAGRYGIYNNFTAFCGSWNPLAALSAPNFLNIDGADNGNIPTDLWRSDVVLTTNTDYCFSFSWASAYQNADFNFDVQVYVLHAGTEYPVGTTQIVQNTIIWTSASHNWNSLGLSGPASIRIRQTTGDDHRDFGIDDICFTKASSQPVCDADFDVIYNECGKFTFNGFALIGTAPFNYAWNFGDNTGIVSGPNSSVMHTYTVAGPYTVTLVVTDALGCTASETVQINVPALFSINISGNTNICAGDCATLTATGAGIVSCQWSANQGSQPTVQVCPPSTTNYLVTCTDANGCTATASVTVNILTCDCDGSLLHNGSFVLGTHGSLPNPGNAPGWNPITTPQMVTTDGIGQQGSMQMWGNQVVGEGIEQPMSIQPGCYYQISFCAKYLPINDPNGAFNPKIRIRATNGSGVVTYLNYDAIWPSDPASDMGYSPTLTPFWNCYTLPPWQAPSTPANLNNFVVTVWNDKVAFDPTQTSWVRVDSICVEKLDCVPAIECGPFSHTGFNYEKGPHIPANCGNTTPVDLQCPLPNQKLYFTGSFNCIGGSTGNAPISWELWRNGSNTGIFGTGVATPFFGIQLFPSYFPIGGIYELRIQGHCGNNVCDCIIKFKIEPCPDDCPCDMETLKKDVGAGFYQTYWSKYCRMCFTPTKLRDCDRVEWSISPSDSSYVNPVGMTNGKTPFCFSFSKGGTYTITMHVIRQRPDGSTCEATFEKKVFVKCSGILECENEVFINPEFDKGAKVGPLGSAEGSDDWVKVSGNPTVKDTSQSGGDDWSIMLSGNDDTFDAIRTETSYCLEKDTAGTIMLRATIWGINHICIDKSTMIFVNLVRGDNYATWPCEGDNCYEIACLQFPDGPDDWVDFQFDYDLRELGVSDDCSGSGAPTVSLRPVVYVGNLLSDDQGGDITYSQVLIDNICLKKRSLVSTDTPKERARFRVFPNPNPGVFSVELPKPATQGMAFRVVGIAGQILREQSAQAGVTMQTVQASDLPTGLYFLQVLSEGKVLATEKFVKQ